MKTRKSVVVGIACGLMAPLLWSAGAAHADPVVPPSGWSETAFIDAAVAQGVPADVAKRGWSDPSLIAQIPVSSSLESSPEQSGASDGSPASSYSAWCSYTKSNAFGQTLARLQVDSSWTAEGAAITGVDATIETEVGWGWAFQGLPYTHDGYSAAYENPRGAHTADRWGNFTWGPDGDATTLKVAITSLALGSHDCSSQEN